MDKEAVREELNKVRNEIKSLKGVFSKKKDEKEGHFEKGEEFSTKINELYDEVKKIEGENNLDMINEELDSKKKELEELKTSVTGFETKFEEARQSQKTTQKPVVKTVSIEKAKSELKKLDLKLQTQVLSLDKESEVIKKMDELKGIVGQFSGESSGEDSEVKTVKKDLNSARRKFSNIERRIRSLYKKIRLISKEKKKKYKLIDDLRDQKKKSFEEFRSQKKEYSGLGKDLRELFKQEEELLLQLGESPVQRKRQSEKNLKAKQKEVEDKLMKKGQILTTEDLLMLQSKK